MCFHSTHVQISSGILWNSSDLPPNLKPNSKLLVSPTKLSIRGDPRSRTNWLQALWTRPYRSQMRGNTCFPDSRADSWRCNDRMPTDKLHWRTAKQADWSRGSALAVFLFLLSDSMRQLWIKQTTDDLLWVPFLPQQGETRVGSVRRWLVLLVYESTFGDRHHSMVWVLSYICVFIYYFCLDETSTHITVLLYLNPSLISLLLCQIATEHVVQMPMEEYDAWLRSRLTLPPPHSTTVRLEQQVNHTHPGPKEGYRNGQVDQERQTRVVN